MTTPNAELAYKVLGLIQVNPEHFDMETWAAGAATYIGPVGLDDLTQELAEDDSCGTTACFAGWAIAVCGYRIGTRADVLYGGDSSEAASPSIENFAAELLGIDGEQANVLFYVENENIADAVAAIFGPRPVGDGHPACGYTLPHPAHDFANPDEERDGEFGPTQQCAGVGGDSDAPR